MKATLKDRTIAESDDIVAEGGYHYFPTSVVRMEWLEKAPKTESDHDCPHGVQFYDVVIEGERYPRAAWIYEAPRPSMRLVTDIVAFCKERLADFKRPKKIYITEAIPRTATGKIQRGAVAKVFAEA